MYVFTVLQLREHIFCTAHLQKYTLCSVSQHDWKLFLPQAKSIIIVHNFGYVTTTFLHSANTRTSTVQGAPCTGFVCTLGKRHLPNVAHAIIRYKNTHQKKKWKLLVFYFFLLCCYNLSNGKKLSTHVWGLTTFPTEGTDTV